MAAKPVKRATEDQRFRDRESPNTLSSASRTSTRNDDPIPAVNRWAIFFRPLRGLIQVSSFMNNAG